MKLCQEYAEEMYVHLIDGLDEHFISKNLKNLVLYHITIQAMERKKTVNPIPKSYEEFFETNIPLYTPLIDFWEKTKEFDFLVEE